MNIVSARIHRKRKTVWKECINNRYICKCGNREEAGGIISDKRYVVILLGPEIASENSSEIN